MKITANQMLAAEQAERETDESFNNRLWKFQFVNGLQNADAHKVIVEEEMKGSVAKPYRQKTVEDAEDDGPQAAPGAAWKPYASSAGVRRLDQAASIRKAQAAAKAQAASDLTPRAKIQVRAQSAPFQTWARLEAPSSRPLVLIMFSGGLLP